MSASCVQKECYLLWPLYLLWRTARSGMESFMLSVSRLRLNMALGTDLSLSTTSPGICRCMCEGV